MTSNLERGRYSCQLPSSPSILKITNTKDLDGIMTTHFITAEIELQETPTELEKAITAELQKQGEPLRWAITAIDETQQTATVEAVVTA